MKNLNKLLLACLSIFALSCTDEVEMTDREAIVAATKPVLLSPQAGQNLVFEKAKENDLAASFVWNDAQYSGTATVVNYSIELAKTGTNFANSAVVSTTIDRFKAVTVGELNTGVLAANLIPFVEHEVDVRIKSTVGTTGGTPQYSNVVKMKVTAYPSWPNWGIIGSATPTGWGSDTNMDYSLATKLYSITIVMSAAEFKFRLDDAWSSNFGGNGNNLTLVDNSQSNLSIPVAGTYKITANFGSVSNSGMAPLTYTAVRQ